MNNKSVFIKSVYQPILNLNTINHQDNWYINHEQKSPVS